MFSPHLCPSSRSFVFSNHGSFICAKLVYSMFKNCIICPGYSHLTILLLSIILSAETNSLISQIPSVLGCSVLKLKYRFVFFFFNFSLFSPIFLINLKKMSLSELWKYLSTGLTDTDTHPDCPVTIVKL